MRLGWSNIAFFQVFLDVFIKFALFVHCQGVYFAIQYFGCIWNKVDFNIPGLVFWVSLCFFFRKDLFPFVVLGRDDLVPGLFFFWECFAAICADVDVFRIRS